MADQSTVETGLNQEEVASVESTPQRSIKEGVVDKLKRGVRWVLEMLSLSKKEESVRDSQEIVHGRFGREANLRNPIYEDSDYADGLAATSEQYADAA
jgi:hypothetical protein